jgi:ABC-2 type transport system permease protein
MRKVIVVAVREYQAAVRTKAFIISLVVMPIFMFGSIVLPRLLRNEVDLTEKRVAVLDANGVIFDTLAEKARLRNETEIFRGEGPTRKQIAPRYVLERIESTGADTEHVGLEQSDRVREAAIFAFMIIPAGIADSIPEGEAPPQIEYFSNNPTYDAFRGWASGPIGEHVTAIRLARANLPPEVVRAATMPTRIANLGLVSIAETGEIEEAKESNELANFFVPFGMLMLMFMVIIVGAPPLAQSVLEEKMQRIAEVLLGSVPPFQLMLGKLIGMVGVALTIGTLYLVGAYVALGRTEYAAFFPSHLVWWFVLYQALAVLMFGSVFIAAGAAVSDLKEMQSLITPVMLVVMCPMLIWIQVVREPSAPFSVFASLFPPATPMLMLVRQAVPPGVPTWQPVLGVVLVLLTTTVCIWAAGRVFRVGILMQGKGAKVGEIIRWIIRG